MPSDALSRSRTVWLAIGRPIVAYCAAVPAASAVFLVIPAAMWIVAAFGSSPPWLGSLVFIARMGGMLALVMALAALIPTLIALVLLRDQCSPRGLAHAVAGGVIGWCMCLGLLAASTYLGPYGAVIFVWFVLAGLVGGYVYWLVSVRPRVRDRRHPSAPTENQAKPDAVRQ